METLKAIQACSVLLKQHAGRMSRLRLLKLLYIAERDSLAETLRPIVGDHIAAMDHGPVMSQTYNLIKREHVDTPLWDSFIVQEGPQDLKLACDPGVGRLSTYEVEKLIQESETRRGMNDYDIAIETHGYEEWVRNKPAPGSSKPIPLDDVLSALHLAEYKQQIVDEIQADAELDRLLASAEQT